MSSVVADMMEVLNVPLGLMQVEWLCAPQHKVAEKHSILRNSFHLTQHRRRYMYIIVHKPHMLFGTEHSNLYRVQSNMYSVVNLGFKRGVQCVGPGCGISGTF